MKDLIHKLAAHRRRIRLVRMTAAAGRWAFYACLLAGGCLAVCKIAGLPIGMAIAGFLVLPAARAIRELFHPFSLADCALWLDRTLGLEERLSSAVEAQGAMAEAVREDALRALAAAVWPRRILPREVKLLPAAGALLGALLAIPMPERAGAAADPMIERFAVEEADRIEGRAVEFREAARILREGDLERAWTMLKRQEAQLEILWVESGGADARAKELKDAAAASAAAVAAQLVRQGRTVHAPPPEAADRKLQRQGMEDVPAGDGQDVESGTAGVFGHENWDKRYDGVIRRYFGGEQ